MSDIVKPDFEKLATEILFDNGINIMTLNDEFNTSMLQAMEEYSTQNNNALLSTVKRLQEENEQLKQWKREEIAVWGPLLDYYYEEDKTIKIGESISKEALRRSKEYVRLQEEKKELVDALNKAKPYVYGAYECAFPDESENDYVKDCIEKALNK